MTLSKILEEIGKVTVFANEDVNEGPAETLSGRRGRKARAVESLKTLREEYISELIRSSVFMVTTGSAKDSFASTASEAFGCFTVEADDFYRDLADRIPESLYKGRESAKNLFDIVGRHLEDKAGEMHIIGYPQLIFKQEHQVTITSKEDFVQLLKTAINGQVGGELAAIHSARSIVDRAIASKHSAKVTPIVLTTSDEKFALELVPAIERLTSKVFLVAAGKTSKAIKSVDGVVNVKEANKESVEAALATVRSSLKK